MRPSTSTTHTLEYSSDTSMPACSFMIVSPCCYGAGHSRDTIIARDDHRPSNRRAGPPVYTIFLAQAVNILVTSRGTTAPSTRYCRSPHPRRSTRTGESFRGGVCRFSGDEFS
jgi:hypothetical protein